MVTSHSSDALDVVFRALSDPTRRAILSRLTREEATVGELAEPFDVSLAAVSKHLKVLEDAGLVRRDREGRTTRCAAIPGAMLPAKAWIDEHRVFWRERLDRLGELLATQDAGDGVES